VKKTTLLLLLFCYLLTTTGFSEFLKINALSVHYSESKKQNQELNFLDFLVMHYITDDNNRLDDRQDNQLPFKSVNLCFSILLFIAPQAIVCFIKYSMNKQEAILSFDEQLTNFRFPNQIWHPPQYS
jgi:hypothetical protein